jgi:hypothetical protein
MAATSSFYNDNLHRAYPFIANQPNSIPTPYLVGIRVYCSYDAPFESFPSVYLTDWDIEASVHTVTFLCTDGTTEIVKQVLIPAGTGMFQTVQSDDTDSICISVITGQLNNISLITKQLEVSGQVYPVRPVKLQIEPVCVFWLRHRGISEIRIGNQARYRLETDAEGLPLEYAPDSEWWNQPVIDNVEDALCLQDQPLLFSEGWNCNLTLSQIDHKIGFGAREGAGLGEVSEDVPRGYIVGRIVEEEIGSGDDKTVRKTTVPDPENGEILVESVPAPLLRFDGLPDNRLIVYSFCGAVGPDVLVQTSDTVLVRTDQSVCTIFVSVANLGGDSC